MDINLPIVALIPALALGSLLAVATLSDLLTHRIPNTICLLLLLSGLTCQTAINGLDGLTTGLAGVATGLLMLLPFYLMGGMAAGDVKMLAASASFLGPVAAIVAGLIALIAGAFLALALVAFRVASGALALQRHSMVTDGMPAPHEAREIASFRFPFALAITLGVIAGAFAGDSLIVQLLLPGGSQ